LTTVDDVADAILSALGPMTSMKLEKLAYYAQAWHLAWHHEPLFEDTIEAWAEGPVVRHLYRQHAKQYDVHEWRSGNRDHLTTAQAHTVDWVVSHYGGFTAEALSRMTHNEVPWYVARNGASRKARLEAPIDRDLMASFYGRQQADTETAVQLAAASASLEGVALDAEWQDKLRRIADGTLSMEDLVQEATAFNGND
jgi:uncharacterized phage-associated protein